MYQILSNMQFLEIGEFSLNMRRRNVVKTIFVCCCLALFLYKTYEVLNSYWKNDIVTTIYHDRQENLHLPLVCISTRNRRFYDKKSLSSSGQIFVRNQNLTYEQYKNGSWRLENVNLTEWELYEEITHRLHSDDGMRYHAHIETGLPTNACGDAMPTTP